MNPQPKQKPARNKAYLKWVALHPCSVPGCPYCAGNAHHENLEGQSTMGGKCGDERTLCLCLRHHRERHDYGRGIWRRNWGVDPEKIIAKLQEEWLKNHDKFW